MKSQQRYPEDGYSAILVMVGRNLQDGEGGKGEVWHPGSVNGL